MTNEFLSIYLFFNLLSGLGRDGVKRIGFIEPNSIPYANTCVIPHIIFNGAPNVNSTIVPYIRYGIV